ncbi:PASTA domain-containing protein [Pseudolysinimonas kribbensis]|nr:PASTA domain-containing protein [Pseudolysinimonas kribbensis]
MAVIVVAALVWVFSLTPQNLVGAGAQTEVPNVIGLEKGAAEKKLEKANLKVNEVTQSSDKIQPDHVISLTPKAGTKVVPGQQVEVVVSTGPATVTLPGLVYKTQDDAQTAIKAAGLVVGEIRSQDSPSVAKGAVVGAQVDGLEGIQTTSVQVPEGKKVNLIVSTGNVNAPDQRGQSFTAARDLLSGPDYQLQVKLVADGSCSGGNVTAQSAIGEVPQKSAVTITYCSGG